LTLVYACISPHGDEIVPKLAGKLSPLFSPTTRGMLKLAAQMAVAAPDTIVVATPHNLRISSHIAVVTSENSTGTVVHGSRKVAIASRCDQELAKRLVEEAGKKGIPVVGVNYGTDSGSLSDVPMDFGTLIPLSFFIRRKQPRRSKKEQRVVIIAPSRGIPLANNFQFGRVVADVSEASGKRVAFVASADQAHAHRRNGPYGYSREAAAYDHRVVEAISENRLRSIMDFDPEFVAAAKPDSLWQMTMLAGLLDRIPLKPELFSYQVPTYYGMACAGYTR